MLSDAKFKLVRQKVIFLPVLIRLFYLIPPCTFDRCLRPKLTWQLPPHTGSGLALGALKVSEDYHAPRDRHRRVSNKNGDPSIGDKYETKKCSNCRIIGFSRLITQSIKPAAEPCGVGIIRWVELLFNSAFKWNLLMSIWDRSLYFDILTLKAVQFTDFLLK